jgi:O-methyltransferase involved in polyketide biosynthesis
VEAFNDFFNAESFTRREEQMQRYRDAAEKAGPLADVAASGNLLYEEEPTEVVDWLSAHGWQATGVSTPGSDGAQRPSWARRSEGRQPAERVHRGGRLP